MPCAPPGGDEPARWPRRGRAARRRYAGAGRHASVRLGAAGALPARPGLSARQPGSSLARASRSRRPSGASSKPIRAAAARSCRRLRRPAQGDARAAPRSAYGRHLHVVQGTGGLGKSAFCDEALKVYARLGWQPLALWCADVEGAAEPVAGLLRQVDAAGRQLPATAWEDVLAGGRADGGAAAEAGSPRLVGSARAASARGATPPLVVYLDNLELLQSGPADGDPRRTLPTGARPVRGAVAGAARSSRPLPRSAGGARLQPLPAPGLRRGDAVPPAAERCAVADAARGFPACAGWRRRAGRGWWTGSPDIRARSSFSRR